MITGHFFLFGCGIVTVGVALLTCLVRGKRRERKRADVMRRHLIQLGHLNLR
jgi:hypothetical protein